MRRLHETASEEEFWPGFADVSLMAVLVLVLLLLLQYVISRDLVSLRAIEEGKREVWSAVETRFSGEVQSDRIRKNDSDPQMLLISFSDQVLFDTGSARLKDEGQTLLLELGDILFDHRHRFKEIKVQGHTDDRPYPSRQYDNWDLSSDRAKAVVKSLSEGLPVDRAEELSALLVAAGYSKYRPIPQGRLSMEEWRRLNRRIDLELVFRGATGLGR